jgi:hypothetical protein
MPIGSRRWARGLRVQGAEGSSEKPRCLFYGNPDLTGSEKSEFQTGFSYYQVSEKVVVIPAKAGIQSFQGILDSRFGGSEGDLGFFHILLESKGLFLPLLFSLAFQPLAS